MSKDIIKYISNAKKRGVSDWEVMTGILELHRTKIDESDIKSIWWEYEWSFRLKEVKEIQDEQRERQEEFMRASHLDDNEDMTQLEKIVNKFQKKGIHLNISYDNIQKYQSRAIDPYHGNTDNVLIIWDIHEPYSLDWYLKFCREQQEIYDCGTIIYIGDIVDLHSLNYHEKVPEELNPAWEVAQARRRLQDRYRTFPQAIVTLWNHDSLIWRQLRTAWLPREFAKDPHAIFQAPKTYEFVDEIIIDNVLYKHYWNAMKKCVTEWMNMVWWHLHTTWWVMYHKNRKWQIRGLQTGTGIDYNRMVFDYAKQNVKDPVLWCGVVLNKWTLPMMIPYYE